MMEQTKRDVRVSDSAQPNTVAGDVVIEEEDLSVSPLTQPADQGKSKWKLPGTARKRGDSSVVSLANFGRKKSQG